MQIIKSRLAILTHDPEVLKTFANFEPLQMSLDGDDFDFSEIEILILDMTSIPLLQKFDSLIRARLGERIKKIVLVYRSNDIQIPVDIYNALNPDVTTEAHLLTAHDIVELSTQIQQASQNDTYLGLANELNAEYEKIKLELEHRITDKTKNLIESRRKIYEINLRIEFLRKALYTISEIRSLSTAEEKLNELLTSYNKVTWFKIVPAEQTQIFQNQIQTHFETTLFTADVKLHGEAYTLYFFKGDKRPFKKSDILLFKKLSETLQINLARIDNLAQLQQNESFFDLAFHSAGNPILVIDQNYQVQQANKAALTRSKTSGQTHCYEILFNRTSKCAGCVLGKNFQVHEENSFFDVHSQPLSLMELEDNQYWVHVYEDSTEKNLYEKKMTQFARLEELGLISSSIAHELNNPLGGILSFIQIMKMELPAQHKLLTDLNMMHETALRMKKIVEDLLIFSRSHHELVLEDLDLYQTTQKILSQFELQYKVEKIKVAFLPPAQAVVLPLSKTLFQDTVNLILQFFLHRAQAKKAQKPQFTSLVEVKISHDQINYYLSFASNLGPLENDSKTKDLNLLAVEKALTDQGFQLFISEPVKDWIQLSVLFPRDLTSRA